MKKSFTVNVSIDQELVKKILDFLSSGGSEEDWQEETTLLGLAKGLGIDLNKKGSWKKLRRHLFYMTEEDLIEERHFQNGLVDYDIENPGIALLEKLKGKRKTS